ncbi:MAG: AsmA family protein [Burkholderiaceae bacterium]
MKAFKYALLGLVGVLGLVISMFGPFKIPYAEALAKTYYRYAIAGLLLVVFLLSGLVAVAVHALDPNQFKSQIVRVVQERTQRELILEGELELSWFPKLGFKAGKASLSQRRSAREFASIDSARVTIAWLPLLRRQFQVDRAEVDGLRAQLVRFKDGSSNIDDLVQDIATISPANIDLQGLHLTRSTLLWNDEITSQRGSLNDIHIEVGRLADGLAGPVTAGVRIDAPQAAVDARVLLKGRLLFDAQAGRIELAKLDAQLEGKALGVDNLALNAKADLTGHLGLRTLSAENLVITSSSKSGLSVFNARLVAAELRLIERRFQGAQLNMDLSLAHPDQTLTAALQLPSFEATGRTLRGAAANAQVSIRGSGAQLRAQMTSPVLLDLDAGPRVEFEALDMTAGASHPALASQTPLSANGKLVFDLAQRSVHLALAGQLAGNELRGQVALSDWRRPHWSFEIASKGIDLDALLAQPCLASWSDDALPLDVSFLRDLTLAGGVSVEQVKLCGLSASGVSAQFDAQRAALRIAPIAARVYGGALEAGISVDASAAPRLSAKGTLSDIDLRAVRADLAHLPWLEGRGELAWDLHGEGGSVGTLRAGLAGGVSLGVRAGKMTGIDLRAALLEGRGDTGKQASARTQEFNAGASTSFNAMLARAELREGRARGDKLEFQSAAVHAIGSGELSFDTGRLDLRLNASVAQAAAEFASLAGLSVPIQIDGPWRLPRFTLDFAALAGAMAPRQVDAAAESPTVKAMALSALAPRLPAARARR